jgi:hypothetical protein
LLFPFQVSSPVIGSGGVRVLIPLLAGTLVGGGIGFLFGLNYGWGWAFLGAQLGATAGVIGVAMAARRP